MRPPNDQRNFVHGRIIGAVGGFLTGGVTGAIGGAVRGGRRQGGQPVSPMSIAGPRNIARRSQCAPGEVRRNGVCRLPRAGTLAKLQRAIPFGATGLTAAGDAIMGQFGAALEPFVDVVQVRKCLPGMVLGKDGNCYNRRDISNKEREWPRGTRPLGTPGEMAALRKAASFGRRMETTVKRMQKIGVLKKPSRPRKQITSKAQHHAGG